MVEEAISYYARRMVAWSYGEVVATYHGGVSRMTGARSQLSTHSIIAIKGAVDFAKDHHAEPHLSNTSLFFRDRHMCAYCGGQYKERDLSRDHVMPVYLGGKDRWMNVVTACRGCNTRKGGRSPEQAGMPLLYVPYVPNRHEHFILRNRRILADQMEYLLAGVPKSSRLHPGAAKVALSA